AMVAMSPPRRRAASRSISSITWRVSSPPAASTSTSSGSCCMASDTRRDQSFNASSESERNTTSCSREHEVVLRSDSLEALKLWSRRVSEAMQQLPELVDVDAAGGEETRQVMLDIDREAARRLGGDMATI